MIVPLLRGVAAVCLVLTMQMSSGYAQPIGTWSFTGNLSGASGPYNAAGPASLGPAGITPVYHGSNEFYGENGWPTGALDPTAYLQFSLTPNAGRELNLTNIVLRMRRSSTGTSGGGPTQWTLRSSLDGYTANIATGTFSTAYIDHAVALSGFNHIYTSVTFRLYGHHSVVSSGGLSRVVWDNIYVYGLIGVLAITPSRPSVTAPERPVLQVMVKGSSITAAIQAPKNDVYTILVHGMNGVLYEKQQVSLKTGANNVALLSRLPRGVYVMSLNGYGSRKFVY